MKKARSKKTSGVAVPLQWRLFYGDRGQVLGGTFDAFTKSEARAMFKRSHNVRTSNILIEFAPINFRIDGSDRYTGKLCSRFIRDVKARTRMNQSFKAAAKDAHINIARLAA